MRGDRGDCGGNWLAEGRFGGGGLLVKNRGSAAARFCWGGGAGKRFCLRWMLHSSCCTQLPGNERALFFFVCVFFFKQVLKKAV